MAGRNRGPPYPIKGGAGHEPPPFPRGMGHPHHRPMLPSLIDEMRDGPPPPFPRGVLGGGGPRGLPPHPAVLEERLGAQHQEIQALLVDNQRLAATHVALKQELAAAQHELQRLSHGISTLHSEKDLQLREVPWKKNSALLISLIFWWTFWLNLWNFFLLCRCMRSRWKWRRSWEEWRRWERSLFRYEGTSRSLPQRGRSLWGRCKGSPRTYHGSRRTFSVLQLWRRRLRPWSKKCSGRGDSWLFFVFLIVNVLQSLNNCSCWYCLGLLLSMKRRVMLKIMSKVRSWRKIWLQWRARWRSCVQRLPMPRRGHELRQLLGIKV